MKHVFSALILFALVLTAQASTSNIDKALAKCDWLDGLTSTQLAKVAKENHMTVAYLHHGCYVLRHRNELADDPGLARSACRKYDRMSNKNLLALARQNNTTVAKIRYACRLVEAPEPSGNYTPSNGDENSSTPHQDDPPPVCQCGAFQVCVQQFSQWKCVDQTSNENRCQSNFDCKGTFSQCQNGSCTPP